MSRIPKWLFNQLDEDAKRTVEEKKNEILQALPDTPDLATIRYQTQEGFLSLVQKGKMDVTKFLTVDKGYHSYGLKTNQDFDNLVKEEYEKRVNQQQRKRDDILKIKKRNISRLESRYHEWKRAILLGEVGRDDVTPFEG